MKIPRPVATRGSLTEVRYLEFTSRDANLMESSSSTPAIVTEKLSKKPKKKRRLRWLLYGVGILAALLVVLPLVAAPIAKGKIVSALEESLHGSVRLSSLSFNLLGSAGLEEFQIDDVQGRPAIKVGQVDAHVGLLKAVGGSYHGEVTIRGLEVHIRKNAQGELNLSRLAKSDDAASSSKKSKNPRGPKGKEKSRKDKTQTSDFPDVKAKVVIEDGLVVIHADDGSTTEIRNLHFECDFDGLGTATPLQLKYALHGPQGQAGGLSLEGNIKIADSGDLGPEALSGSIRYKIDPTDLAALQPAALTLAAVEQLSGHLSGNGELLFLGKGDARDSVQLQAGFEVKDLRAAGEAVGPEAIELERLELTAQYEASEQRVRLDAGRALQVEMTGPGIGALGADGEHRGQLEVHSALGELVRLLGGRIPLREGVALDGELTLTAQYQGQTEAGGLDHARLDASMQIEDFTATDGIGRQLDLGELRQMNMALQSEAEWKIGRVHLTQLDLQAGPIVAQGQGAVSGLHQASVDAIEVEPSELTLTADLDRLSELLSRILETDTPLLTGQVEAKTTVQQDGEQMRGRSVLEVNRLQVGGLAVGEETVELGPLNLSWNQNAVFDSTANRLSIEQWDLESDLARGNGNFEFENLGSSDAAMVMNGRMQLQGEIVAFKPYLEAFLPEMRTAQAQGSWTAEFTAANQGDENSLQPSLAIHGLSLSGYRVGEKNLDIVQADVSFKGDLQLNTASSGRLEVRSMNLNAPGLSVQGTGRVSNFAAEAQVGMQSDFDLNLDMEPNEVNRRLAAFLAGMELAGEPIRGELKLSAIESQYNLQGQLDGKAIILTMPASASGTEPSAPKVVKQNDVNLKFDVQAEMATGQESLEVAEMTYASSTANLNMKGNLRQFAEAENTAADFDLRAQGDLARVVADFGSVAGLSDYDAAGDLDLNLKLKGAEGRLNLSGTSDVRELMFRSRTAQEGTAPQEMQEPHLNLVLNMDFATARQDLLVRELEMRSSFLRGSMTGGILNLASMQAVSEPTESADTEIGTTEVVFDQLKGQFYYNPDALGVLLAPWLPGELSGAEEEEFSFHFDGKMQETDLFALLRQSNGKATMGIGDFKMAGLQTRGTVDMEVKDDLAIATTVLQANGGTLNVDTRLDLRQQVQEGETEPKSFFNFSLNEVQANQEMGAMLGHFHPMLHSAEDLAGSLVGLLSGELNLTYEGPMDQETLTAGWDELSLDRFSGRGSFQLSKASLKGSALFSDMLGRLGVNAESLDIEPVGFVIRRGRLRYTEPFKLSLGGIATSFDGSVGLDKSVRLNWTVPVTADLAQRYSFLGDLQGESIKIPITGSISSPKLQWDDALQNLAKGAIDSKVQDQVGNALGGLGGLLESKEEKEAAEMLKKADRLYEQGKSAEALKAYEDLKSKHKKTETFKENRRRVNVRINELKGGGQ